MFPYDDEDRQYDRPATESEAHAEWHRNTGIPMGTPGCPQDACHLTREEADAYDDDDTDDDTRPCGCPADYHMADCPIITSRYASDSPCFDPDDVPF